MYIRLPNRVVYFWIFAVPLCLFTSTLWGESSLIGAPISDLSNGVWSLWYFADNLLNGDLNFCDTALNYPTGGCLVPADWTGLLWMVPLLLFTDPIAAFNGTMYAQTVMIGFGLYLLHQAWFPSVSTPSATKNYSPSALHAAILVQLSTIVRTGLHNGSTEVLSLGWVLLGLLGWNQVLKGYLLGWFLILPVIATSWYGVVGFVLIALIQGLLHWRARGCCFTRTSLTFGAMVFLIWGGFVYWVLQQSKGTGDLLRIKGAAEMDSVRRTIGSADPLTYVVPWSYSSPDFTEVSRFGEQFVHSAYIGWVVLGTCLWGVYKRRRHWLLWVSVCVAILSLGPVLVMKGEPVIVGSLGIPLPYFALESLPLFDHLTLLYRLSWVPIVGLTCLATTYWNKRYQWGFLLFAVCESIALSPVRSLPNCTDVSTLEVLEILQEQPSGAIGFYPLQGGRPYMMSQLWHHQPMATTLNFPANSASIKILETMRLHQTAGDEEFKRAVVKESKRRGIRYWIVDRDPSIMPDTYLQGVEKVTALFPAVLTTSGDGSTEQGQCDIVWRSIVVVQFW